MEKLKTYREIRNTIKNIGIVYMTTQCIDIDIQCIGHNDFNSIDEVLSFYRNLDSDSLIDIYIEYYGLGDIID